MPKQPKPVTVEQLDQVIDSMNAYISGEGELGAGRTPYSKEVCAEARNHTKHLRDILLGLHHDQERKK